MLSQLQHLPAAIQYINQITSTETLQHCYMFHNWNAQIDHPDNQTHKHSFFEVCYVVRGTGIYEENNQQYSLQPGVLFCSRPHIWHRIYDCQSLHLIWVCFEINRERSSVAAIQQYEQLSMIESIYKTDVEQSPTLLIWQALLRQADQLIGLSTILQPLAATLVISVIEDFLPISGAPKRSVTISTDANRLLQQAKAFINDNLSQPLLFSQIAQYLHLSERTLSRIFAEHSPLTFKQYVLTVRLQKAEQLLLQTDTPIKEIAIQTGFESVHYLTRVFTQHYSMPPGQYRNHARNSDGKGS